MVSQVCSGELKGEPKSSQSEMREEKQLQNSKPGLLTSFRDAWRTMMTVVWSLRTQDMEAGSNSQGQETL